MIDMAKSALAEVSVALATFNGERYLAQQLETLRRQWRLPKELIVVDDASSDRSVEIVKQFAKTAPFDVVLVDHHTHLGTNRAFGDAITMCTGDIIVTCDQDDLWYPDKISILVGALEAQADAYIAFSDAGLITASGHPLRQSRWHVAGFSQVEQDAMSRDPLGQMLSRRVMSGCTAAIRRDLIDAILPIPGALAPTLNEIMYDHWISLIGAASGPVVMVSRQLVDYRIHPRQQIGIPGLAIRRWAPRLALRAAQFRPSRAEMDRRFEFDSRHIDEIRTRLARTGLGSGGTEHVLTVTQRHLRSRQQLDLHRLRRVPDVLSELRSDDGYRRFGYGAITALADIAR